MPLLTDTASTRIYLSRELANISDADPQILADYILALLRHDKPMDEMKRVCLENLHDFLHERTERFVESLFEYLVKGERAASTLHNNNTTHPQQQYSSHEQVTREENDNEDRHGRRHDRRRERERELSPESRHRRSFPSSRGSSRHRAAHPFPFPPPPMSFGVQPPFGMQRSHGIHIPRPPHRTRRNVGEGGDTRLVVDRIPFEHCSIASVNSFFSKFGTLVNVTVNADQRRARIQFATNEEAHQAYHSADAIFDNRFVKLYWDREGEDIPAPQITKSLEMVRDAPMNPPTLASAMDVAAAKRQEALKTMLSLQKQQQELLTRYIDQQKALMIRLESGNVNDTDKAQLVDSLRNVDSLIVSMRESMQMVETKLGEMASQGVVATSAKPEYKSPVLRGGPNKRASSSSRRESRAAASQSYKLDMRPKCLLLRPLPSRVGGDIDSLRKLFEPYGSIKSIKLVDNVDGTDKAGALVEFSQRHEAEQAMFYMSKSDLGEPFELHWIQQHPQPVQLSPDEAQVLLDADVNMLDGEEQVGSVPINDSLEAEKEGR
jgi:PWI domain-containing protein/RNA recognition motif-containing protein